MAKSALPAVFITERKTTMEISRRLQAVADLVSYPIVADIGTDHGYVPLYLYENGKTEKAFACDLNKQPLEKAKQNIKDKCAEHVIETRLGSGLLPIAPKEAQTAVIAGMGGMLVLRILQEGKQTVDSLQELILSPQHDIDKVRKYVHTIGFAIKQEIMVKEDGKYYHILQCQKGAEQYQTETAYQYGEKLLQAKDALLWEQLEIEQKQYETVQKTLQQSGTEKATQRLIEIKQKLQWIEEAKAWYK